MTRNSLAFDLAMALDPVIFCQQAGVIPDAWQSRLLRSTAPAILLNAARQSGKSSICAALALWTAIYQPGALVLVLAPSLRQSAETFRKVLTLYRTVGRSVVPSDAETIMRLELANQSRIVALPGSEASVRGFSGVSLLIVDEAARVDDSLIFSTRPMLATSNGRLVCLSTPFGRRGFFFESWSSGDMAWERYRIEASDCPRISAAFLNEERRLLPRQWFEQEYCCQFVETDSALFTSDLIRSAFDPSILPLFGAA